MWQRPFFHAGMSELQDRFDGRRVAETIERHRKHYEFWDDEKEMIETSPFFFIGTSFDDYVDCNIKSGDPGFVKVVGSNVIEYPEYDGNSMYRTLGNLSRNPNLGLLFVRFDGKSSADSHQRQGVDPGRCGVDRPAFRRAARGADRVRNLSELPALCARSRQCEIFAIRCARRTGHAAGAGMEATRLHPRHPAQRRSTSRNHQGKGRLTWSSEPEPVFYTRGRSERCMSIV